MQSFLKKLKGFCPTLQGLFKNARAKLKTGLDDFQKCFDLFGKKSRRISLFILLYTTSFPQGIYLIYIEIGVSTLHLLHFVDEMGVF